MDLVISGKRKRGPGDAGKKRKARKINCSDCNSPVWENTYCSRCGHFVDYDTGAGEAADDDLAAFMDAVSGKAPLNEEGKDDKKDEEEEEEEEEKEDTKALAANCKAEGNAAFKAGRHLDAVACYTEAIGYEPQNAVLWSNRSAALLSAPSPSDALVSARECVEVDPTFVKGYSRLGAAYLKLKRFDEAISAYKRGLQVDANNAAIKTGIAHCIHEKKLHGDKPVPPLRMTHPDAEDAIKDGNAAIARENNTLAIRHLTEALKEVPGDAALWAKRSAAMLGSGSALDALANAREALRVEPKLVEGFLRAGQALQKLNKHDDAADMFEKGLELDAEHQELKDGLDAAMSAGGDFDDLFANMK